MKTPTKIIVLTKLLSIKRYCDIYSDDIVPVNKKALIQIMDEAIEFIEKQSDQK